MYAIAARANAPAGLTHRPLTRTSGSSLKLNSEVLGIRAHRRVPGPAHRGCGCASLHGENIHKSTHILHPQFSNQIAYAHRFALPGFRADARLHQRRHHGQEVVRVDVCQIASVPILTNVVNTRSKTYKMWLLPKVNIPDEPLSRKCTYTHRIT